MGQALSHYLQDRALHSLPAYFTETLLPLFLNSQQNMRKAKPLNYSLQYVFAVLMTYTVELVHLLTLPSHGTTFSKMPRRSLCQQVPRGGQEKEGIQQALSQGR